jgi:MFS family permease
MSELTNLRGFGAVLGAAFGAAIGFFLALLVVFLTPAIGIRWPVPPSAVLLAALVVPIVLTGLVGVFLGPAVPGMLNRVSNALRTDEAASRVETTDTSRSLVLHVSRGFTAIYLVLGLGMTGMAVFLIVVAAPSMGVSAALVGWAGSLFFGAITVLFLVQFAWPKRFGLTLDKDGFTVRMNLGSRRYRWVGVERFFPYHTVALQPVVAFKYRGKAEIHGVQMTRGGFGTFDGSLPQNLSIRGLALLELMERWRSRIANTSDKPETSN